MIGEGRWQAVRLTHVRIDFSPASRAHCDDLRFHWASWIHACRPVAGGFLSSPAAASIRRRRAAAVLARRPIVGSNGAAVRQRRQDHQVPAPQRRSSATVSAACDGLVARASISPTAHAPLRSMAARRLRSAPSANKGDQGRLIACATLRHAQICDRSPRIAPRRAGCRARPRSRARFRRTITPDRHAAAFGRRIKTRPTTHVAASTRSGGRAVR